MDQETQPRKIFIGGTGRSGTTILSEVLSSHPRVYTFTQELRFHIDPYGLLPLHRALTRDYSPPVARQAWLDFLDLMQNKLCAPLPPPYIGFNLKKTFGRDFYFDQISALEEQLIYTTWTGNNYHMSASSMDRNLAWLYRFIERVGNIAIRYALRSHYSRGKRIWLAPSHTIRDTKFFEDENQLALVLGTFFDNLLSARAGAEGCDVWCEHTPGNAINASFLASMLPNSCLIYTHRNPWSLALSYRRRSWAPKSLEDVCQVLQFLFRKWQFERCKLEEIGYSFLEVALEDLTSGSDEAMKSICNLIGIDFNFSKFEILDKHRHSLSQTEMSKEDVTVLERYFPNQSVPMYTLEK